MGTTFTRYNPTTYYGQYNIKNDTYNNKQKVLLVLGTLLLIAIGIAILVWSSKDTSNQEFSPYTFPPAQYGSGPYGYGSYLPTKNILAETLAYS